MGMPQQQMQQPYMPPRGGGYGGGGGGGGHTRIVEVIPGPVSVCVLIFSFDRMTELSTNLMLFLIDYIVVGILYFSLYTV